MPKFRKKCSNPLHEEWVSREGQGEELNLINLRARGLGDILAVLKQVLVEKGRDAHNVGCNMCSFCLETCTQRLEFSKYFPSAQCSSIRTRVRFSIL